ncbi:putative glutamate--cysteine ligase [Actinoplanes missouriensis 431]|uniref:Putative glutamate--cysteine ligase 2 n=1 Tax=Actinoplanes missouriensis (strain ATCC 14538 / DSM 43046 / CBS 188.64 / JCM 3121 / NBRC 102363 / NCIMB 12654 / NRRL B-3342 / UNCC 431) TaxID=512565 RepID=I0HFM9_ACTM4|nr:carboxylate--amine ligase/circularly permuted type 2 ATP-grasp protein [Actinoplanes missouriensis]BAL91816.1 putative glutamate--cysteine ligase [Actinoplanes missouriensis 431]
MTESLQAAIPHAAAGSEKTDKSGKQALTLGVEEELHVVDLGTRELVPQAPEILDRLDAAHFSAELHRSVVETNTPVSDTLDGLRAGIIERRRSAITVAESLGLGLVAAGTVPLVDLDRLPVTPTSRYQRMLHEYQMLVREQLICGAQVHVGVPDRDEAVAVAQRVTPVLPVLLALSASSPYWMGEDSGYASVRSLVWMRWPTAGDSGPLHSAAEHEELVSDLIASGTISDPKMVYFDVRPSAHVPTVELRVTDASSDVETVVLIAGLFRALVLRAQQQHRAYLNSASLDGALPNGALPNGALLGGAVPNGALLNDPRLNDPRLNGPLLNDPLLNGAGGPIPPVRPPLHRAAMWRAARSGLEGDLLDLPRSPVPVPAGVAVERLIGELRPQLEELGDWEQVYDLSLRALSRGSSAARQRRALGRRGRLADVVDMLVSETRGETSWNGGAAPASAGLSGVLPDAPSLEAYGAAGDEAFPDGRVEPAYAGMLPVLTALGASGLRQREDKRDDEQRARGITFSVAGEAATRLFPFDLVPRIVPAADWGHLRTGLTQRVQALDAFLTDVYGERQIVSDGVIPEWVVNGSPELRASGALIRRRAVRTQVAGVDLVKDSTTGEWRVLEDNLRVPSGIAYAMQNRRLTWSVLPELPRPAGLVSVEETPKLLKRALLEAAGPAAGDDPHLVVLSQGPDDSAWFEHKMLAEAMEVPVVRSTELFVDEGPGVNGFGVNGLGVNGLGVNSGRRGPRVWRLRDGHRYPVDVIYLRMGEDSLVHSPGADGMPLGPSLVSALHADTVVLANALGNGIADDKAVYAYVPRMIEYYLGEKPILADVRTYLCGLPDQRVEVLSRLDELVCKPVDGYGGDRIVIGPHATADELDALRRQIQTAPHRWVAQELVQLSTHPVFDGHRLAPRHVDLRAFVFTGKHSTVAPAALTRVAPAGSMIVNSSRGGGSKDTWLLG